MITPKNSVSPEHLIYLPLKDEVTPLTPQEQYSPNNLKYYNEHLNKTQFNAILINCALMLLRLNCPGQEFEQDKLRYFVIEVLRRSKTTTQSLQICCYYLCKAIDIDRPKPCPKKLFLGMLILASKFNQDHNYSFKTWLKICGCKQDDLDSSLNLKKLKQTEIACLQLLDYDLYINASKYENWCNVLLIFGYDFISLHQVPAGVMKWCDSVEAYEKLARWRKFMVLMDDNSLATAKVDFHHYYANQIGTKVVTTGAPGKQGLKRASVENDDGIVNKRLCN